MASAHPTSLRLSLLYLVAIAIIPAYALLGHSALELHDRVDQEALATARQLSMELSREQERVFREARELSQILASVPGLTDPAQRKFCERFLADAHRTMPRYGNMGVASADGNIFCSAVRMKQPVNVSDRAYFRHAVESRQFSAGDYVIGRITGKPSITVGLPLLDADNRVRGVIFAAIDLAWIEEVLLYNDLPAESSVSVIDRDGVILARYPPDATTGHRIADANLPQAIKAVSVRPSSDVQRSPQSWMRDNLAYALYPITDGTRHPAFVWAMVSNSKVAAEIKRRFISYLAWIGIATLMVFALARIFGNKLVIDNIRAIADAARRFADGNLTARTGLKRAPAEIAGLADTFDRMAEGVESRERRIEEISTELARSNRILRTLSGSNRTLLRAVDEQTLLEDMCRIATETGGYRAAWVGYMQHDERKSVRLMAHAGLERPFFEALNTSWAGKTQAGICGRAISSGSIVISDDPQDDPDISPWREQMHRHGISSAIALPLFAGGGIIGMMAIYAVEKDAFKDKDRELLDELAADLSFGIDTIRNRAEHRRAEAALEHLALHDSGTGLPNQAGLRRHLAGELDAARDTHYPVALIAINLPRMREIGDILGIHSVNQCITRIAVAVQETAGAEALVAREGRFTLAVTRPRLDIAGATALAERLSSAVHRPFELGSCTMEIEACIGISVFPGQASDPDGLVGRASLAAQHAHASGRPYALLESSPEDEALKRLTMLGELRTAIDGAELEIHYQPKIDAATGRIVGAEALVRWRHPVRGMVSPAEFVPLAERTGLIKPLTYKVLQMVGQQLYAWRKAHGLALPVAVNLSAHNLHDAGLPGHIDSVIGTWGLERQLLQIEITESTLMRDPAEALNVLRRFSDSGMQLFIDDFGTGYSSLAYLASLPVNALKIDRSFVNSMSKNTQHRAIVHSILSLAGSLGLKVVAEGVETREQADLLRELACDELQGYLFSKPLPPEQFIDWVLRNR